jgi:hypothetical protein
MTSSRTELRAGEWIEFAAIRLGNTSRRNCSSNSRRPARFQRMPRGSRSVVFGGDTVATRVKTRKPPVWAAF